MSKSPKAPAGPGVHYQVAEGGMASMALQGWSCNAAIGPVGLGDRLLLDALAAAIPDGAVEAAIEVSGTRQQRRRWLSSHLVVTLVVATGRPGHGGYIHPPFTMSNRFCKADRRR